MKKVNFKIMIFVFLGLICFTGFIISTSKIIKWKIDGTNIEKQVEKIQETIKVTEIDDNEKTEIIEPTITIPETNPYWDYIKMKLIDVDFNELKKINKESKGWIKVNGTNINYPFVQARDNEYYLNHAFDKSSNGAGWIFLDYRNTEQNNKNTIIYGHGRYDNTMFGSLKNILTSGWLDNTDNYIVKLSTEKENTLWQVFSVYRTLVTSDYLQTDFDDDNEFEKFTKMLIDRSEYKFNTEVYGNDRILTLSTCYKDEERVVLHAKLIKIEKK